jgi:hypothetical protein
MHETEHFGGDGKTLHSADTAMTNARVASHIVLNKQGDSVAKVAQNRLLFPLLRKFRCNGATGHFGGRHAIDTSRLSGRSCRLNDYSELQETCA